MSVAGFGDSALTAPFSRRMLTRHKTDVGHKLLRILEATQVVELGGDHHGGLCVDAAEAAEPSDDLPVTRRDRDLLDLLIECCAAAELVIEQGQIPSLGAATWNPPMDINNRGDVVGFSNIGDNANGNPRLFAFLWTGGSSAMNLQALPVTA